MKTKKVNQYYGNNLAKIKAEKPKSVLAKESNKFDKSSKPEAIVTPNGLIFTL
jgi:hypothetical protein